MDAVHPQRFIVDFHRINDGDFQFEKFPALSSFSYWKPLGMSSEKVANDKLTQEDILNMLQKSVGEHQDSFSRVLLAAVLSDDEFQEWCAATNFDPTAATAQSGTGSSTWTASTRLWSCLACACWAGEVGHLPLEKLLVAGPAARGPPPARPCSSCHRGTDSRQEQPSRGRLPRTVS